MYFVRFKILEMSANSRLKTASGARPLSSIGTEKNKTSHGTRKPKNQSAPVEKLRNLTKLNQETAMQISKLDSDRDKLFSRIQALQDHLIQEQDLISGLKSKISQLTNGVSNFTTSNTTLNREDDLSSTSKSKLISPANCNEFLQNRPMILTYILGFDEDFIKFIANIDDQTKPLFITKSSNQLNRFYSCFLLFQTLTNKVQSYEFISICKEKMKAIFNTNTIIFLIKDPKTAKFECFFDDKELYYEINEQNSMIAASLNRQEVIMQNQNVLSDTLRVDLILNPNCQPTILIPVSKEACILILSDKTGDDKNFSPEDQIVSIFLSELLRLLFDDHLRFLNLMKEVELRRFISLFQREIITKNDLQLLLPYLYRVVSEFTLANDVELFILGEKSFYTIEFEEGKMNKKKLPFSGIPRNVIETKKIFITEKLSSQETSFFDSAIDMWGMNKCYAAFPIFLNNTEPIAVFCVIDKNQSNSFNGFDIEFLESISSSIGVVLPKCIESSGQSPNYLPFTNLKKFVNNVSHLNRQFVNENDSVSKMVKDLQSLFQCEWITVYSKNQRNFVKRLLTLYKDEIVGKSIILDESLNSIFNREKKFIAETEMTKISSFFKISVSIVQSLLYAHDDNIAIFCFNCCSIDEIHKSIMKSSLTAISYAYEIESSKQEINDNRNSGISLRNVFDVTTTAMQNENPFLSLLTMICDLISMTTFALFRYEKSKESYEIFLSGKEVKEGSIDFSDSFIRYAATIENKTVLIDKFVSTEYSSSQIVQLFPYFSHVVIFPVDFQKSVFAVFVGESVTMNYELLLIHFSPIILCLYKNYVLKNESVVVESNVKSDLYLKLNVVDSEISARLFSVQKYDENYLVGIVVKMFQNLDLIAVMRIIEPSDFLATILSIRSAYDENPNSFHNFRHAVDCTQFIYSCLVRGRMRRYFTPIQMSALLLAALCHDVGHKGLNSSFHVKAKTNLFFTFGDQSPLERFHCAKAHQILQKSPIFSGIDKPQFWNFFVNSIVATDMMRHFEFIESFKKISNRFEFGNERHQLVLAQFLIKCANVANTTRTFDVAFHFAEGLLIEYKNQSEKEKEINVELTKFCDDESLSGNNELRLWSIEVAFYTGIVAPMLKLLSTMVPDLSDFRLQMEDNKRQWEEYGQKQIQKEKEGSV